MHAVSSRALVVGVMDPAVEGDALVPAAEALVRAGADLVEVADPAVAARLRATADLPVVGPGAAPGPLADDAAALAVAVVQGAPAVRTHDVRAARRVVDVLATVAEAAGPTPPARPANGVGPAPASPGGTAAP